jgi:ABC-2 type transport system permease protein
VNPRIRAVVRRELRDFRRNKFVIGTMVFLPLFLVLLPIGNILSLEAGAPAARITGVVGGATLTFFLVPLILPTVIAGYGVIGEREQGTLEPVLTTPVTASELLIGKAVAAVVPSALIAYGMYALYVVVVTSFAIPAVVDLVVDPAQFLAVVLFAPLLSGFSIWVGLAISARSSDVRVAQQLAGLAMLPMLGLLSRFAFGIVTPSIDVAIGGAALLLFLDGVAWRLVSAMFDRERLLTRYGKS